MKRILVCSGSTELADSLAASLRAASASFSISTVSAADFLDGGMTPWRAEGAGPPQVLLLDCSAGFDDALVLTTRLDSDCPAISVVLVTAEGSEVVLSAMRAGATDILHPAAEALEVLRVLQRATELAEVRFAQRAGPPTAPVELPPSGQVISVVSPKGGVGKTTVSTNLAVGLARHAPKATVLVDLDIQFGDVASGLNLDPEYFLPSAVTGPASHDTMVLKTFLTLHETGLYVICAPESPVEADDITADQVRRLLRTLSAEFRYVVVDTAPGLSEHTLAAMDESTDLVLLSSMDVPGLRGLRKEIETLRDLKLLQRLRHQVVVNFAHPSVGLSREDLEATIGAPVDAMLPRSKAAPGSVNLGVPLLQSGVRDPLTKALRGLVARFTVGAAQLRPAESKVKAATSVPRRAASGWFRRSRTVTS